MPVKYLINDILGKPEHIGRINSAPLPPQNRLLENNPHGHFFVDAMKNGLDTDIALLNSANIRGYFEKGDIDERMVTEISPFKNKMVVAKLSEKDIVDAIKLGGTSFKNSNGKPGIVLVSGLKYVMNKKGELLKLTYIDKNGKENDIDINNPNPNKFYRTAMDDFYASGGDNFYMLNKIWPFFIIISFIYSIYSGNIFNINQEEELWLNNSIANLNRVPSQKWCKIYKKYSNLTVYIVIPEYLIGMKLESGREKDQRDISAIIQQLDLDNPILLYKKLIQMKQMHKIK